MTKTRQITLKDVQLLEATKGKVVVKNAELLIHQEYIPDGRGGHLAGMRSWEIKGEFPLGLSLSPERLTFTAGKYSGTCFATNQNTLQGTGVLSGIE